MSPVPAPVLRVLVVCTANICRSPMAAALLGRAAADAGVPVTVSSAGFLFDGRPASDTTMKVMRDHDLDLSAHRSRIVDDEILAGVDLVLTMERRHARDLALAHDVAPRTHTLKSFAALVSRRQFGPGPTGVPAPVRDLHALVAAAHEARSSTAFLGDGRPDEVDDPHGRSARVHRRAVEELSEAIDAIVASFAAAQEEVG